MEKALERPEGECMTSAEAAASWAPGSEVGRPCCLFRVGGGGGEGWWWEGILLNISLNRGPTPTKTLLNDVPWEQVLRNAQTNFCSDYILINTFRITF